MCHRKWRTLNGNSNSGWWVSFESVNSCRWMIALLSTLSIVFIGSHWNSHLAKSYHLITVGSLLPETWLSCLTSHCKIIQLNIFTIVRFGYTHLNYFISRILTIHPSFHLSGTYSSHVCYSSICSMSADCLDQLSTAVPVCRQGLLLCILLYIQQQNGFVDSISGCCLLIIGIR